MKGFTTKKYRKKSQCARASFRTKKVGSRTRLTFCCPRGRWKRGRCRSAMKLYEKHSR